ncbi:MAG: Gfo/Idh/MocA family oxidoreductase [Clostridia bacterium]|nr:Gfo/Idh/MocA family oxidoreductase [Clostridia bacterium]
MNNKIRIGIAGIGNMGSAHLANILDGKIKNGVLGAVCDVDKEKLEKVKNRLPEDTALFDDTDEMIASGRIDAILIATPHYFHPTIAKKAFEAGLHVFCEKPAGVYTKNVREMNEAAKKSGKVFQVNFVLRTLGAHIKIKELIDSGELGEIKRFTWILTDWYRTQSYYNSGGWRATWAGEGGGTLLNQNPHQLDLMQWFFGMPERVRGFCYFGKNRDIEVEDEATAYFEYKNGAVGVYMTSVSEYPGTNRLEIAGDRGKLVYENGKITFFRTAVGEKEFNRTTKTIAGPIPMWECDVKYKTITVGDGQARMVDNWVETILGNETLVGPGEEGINSLAISNAIYLSQWNDSWVRFPFDEDEFLEKLNEKIRTSVYVKQEVAKTEGSFEDTFQS